MTNTRHAFRCAAGRHWVRPLAWAAAACSALLAPLAQAQYSSPMRDVENPDRTPYAESVSVTIAPPFVNNFAFLPTPAGKRVVLEQAALLCVTPSATDQVSVGLLQATKVLGSGVTQSMTVAILVPQRRAGLFSGVQWADSQRIKAYSDAVPSAANGGFGISVNVYHSETSVTAQCTVSVSGHLFTP